MANVYTVIRFISVLVLTRDWACIPHWKCLTHFYDTFLDSSSLPVYFKEDTRIVRIFPESALDQLERQNIFCLPTKQLPCLCKQKLFYPILSPWELMLHSTPKSLQSYCFSETALLCKWSAFFAMNFAIFHLSDLKHRLFESSQFTSLSKWF